MSTFFAFCRIVLGLIFMAASVDKILHPAAFAEIVRNYQILPDLFVNPVAMVLPWLELMCGAALACGVFRRGASLLVMGMLSVFIVVMWYNISRGLDISCGCFSVRPGAKGDMMFYVWRDTALLALSIIVLWRSFADFFAERASNQLQRDIRMGRLRPARKSMNDSMRAKDSTIDAQHSEADTVSIMAAPDEGAPAVQSSRFGSRSRFVVGGEMATAEKDAIVDEVAAQAVQPEAPTGEISMAAPEGAAFEIAGADKLESEGPENVEDVSAGEQLEAGDGDPKAQEKDAK